jgi:hypothetical protein
MPRERRNCGPPGKFLRYLEFPQGETIMPIAATL